MGWLSAALEIASKALGWAFSSWKKKNDPTVHQRTDQIAKDYDAKRDQLKKL